MTAMRDLVYDDRPRHSDALKLLALAERGDLELGVPPQGSLADLRGEFGGDLADRIKTLLAKPGVVGLPQLARLSNVTFPAENLFPGYYVEGFSEAWDHIAATWKTHQGKCPGSFDRWYVESHIADSRDVLLTDDKALQAMCDRLRKEHGLAVRTQSLSDYVAGRI
jgi:hypothetical protein